jgi:hypothetical protein
VSHDPLRCVVCDTGFVTDPWRERLLVPAVTYPDVFGMACKLKVLEPLRILSDGGSCGSWSLYELYAALVTGPSVLANAAGVQTSRDCEAGVYSLSKTIVFQHSNTAWEICIFMIMQSMLP